MRWIISNGIITLYILYIYYIYIYYIYYIYIIYIYYIYIIIYTHHSSMFLTFLLTPPRHPGVNADANGQRWQAQLLELFVQRPQGLRIDRDQWPQWDQWPQKNLGGRSPIKNWWISYHQSKIDGFHMFWSDFTLNLIEYLAELNQGRCGFYHDLIWFDQEN